MPEDSDRRLFDKRVVQRYMRRGRLDEKEYERHLKGLPDLATEAVPIESNLDVDDFEEEEEVAPQAAASEQQPAVASPPSPGPTIEATPSATPAPGGPPPGEPPSEG